MARQLNLPPREVGLSDEMLRPVPPATNALVVPVDPVAVSQEWWRATRLHLEQTGGPVSRAAVDRYQPLVEGLGDVPTLTAGHWVPDQPLELSTIQIRRIDEATGVDVTAAEPEAAGVLPLHAHGRRFARHTSPIRCLDRPRCSRTGQATAF